jgi:hypothetical protein
MAIRARRRASGTGSPSAYLPGCIYLVSQSQAVRVHFAEITSLPLIYGYVVDQKAISVTAVNPDFMIPDPNPGLRGMINTGNAGYKGSPACL